MDHLVPDLRYAIASLRRTPALTVTVLATLALGIGATTAVFTVVHAGAARAVAVARVGSAGAAVGRTSRRRVTRRQPLAQPADTARVDRRLAHARRCRQLRCVRLHHPPARDRADARPWLDRFAVGLWPAASDAGARPILRRRRGRRQRSPGCDPERSTLARSVRRRPGHHRPRGRHRRPDADDRWRRPAGARVPEPARAVLDARRHSCRRRRAEPHRRVHDAGTAAARRNAAAGRGGRHDRGP